MKKLIALVLTLVCVLGLVSCSKTNELQQGDNNMQYFFSAKVIEVDEAYLRLKRPIIIRSTARTTEYRTFVFALALALTLVSCNKEKSNKKKRLNRGCYNEKNH